eukprot:5647561-Pyramimonas_sp.AAC.1
MGDPYQVRMFVEAFQPPLDEWSRTVRNLEAEVHEDEGARDILFTNSVLDSSKRIDLALTGYADDLSRQLVLPRGSPLEVLE